MYDAVFYILAFAALSPVFWYVGSGFNQLGEHFLRSRSALGSFMALLGYGAYALSFLYITAIAGVLPITTYLPANPATPVGYILWFVLFAVLGAILHIISIRWMQQPARMTDPTDETGSASAIASLAALMGTLCNFAAVAGGLIVLTGLAIGVAIVLMVGGAILLLIMLPVMVGSLLMSLILEPIIARSAEHHPVH